MNTLNRPTLDEYKMSAKLGFTVVAENVRSGQNVGALFRTADAFGASQVSLSGISPVPPNKEVLKTALGATESVSWNYYASGEELIAELKHKGIKIIAVEQTTGSIPLQNFKPEADSHYAIIFGNEVDGVSEHIIKNADLCIEIPQIGTKHSLNVSVCAGIVMWHMFRELSAI